MQLSSEKFLLRYLLENCHKNIKNFIESQLDILKPERQNNITYIFVSFLFFFNKSSNIKTNLKHMSNKTPKKFKFKKKIQSMLCRYTLRQLSIKIKSEGGKPKQKNLRAINCNLCLLPLQAPIGLYKLYSIKKKDPKYK